MKGFDLRDQEGMTMVEIIIASALVLIVALGVAEIFVQANKAETSARLKQAVFISDQEWDYQFKIAPLPSP